MPSALKKFFIRAFEILAFIYLLLCIGLAFAQPSLIFHPTHRPNKNPEWTTEDIDSDMPVYAGVVFGVKRPNHVYFLIHGNEGQADDMDYYYKLLPAGSALYVMEYPGYGKRGGAFIQNGINATALRSYDFLEKRFVQSSVTVIGESLGVGPAAYIASLRPVENLYLITPYHDLPGLLQQKIPWLPAAWLCTYRWDVAELLKNFEGHLTLVGVRNDTLVPAAEAQRLSQELPRAHLEIIDGTHNNWDEDAMKNILQGDNL